MAKTSDDGWCMVQTIVLPLAAISRIMRTNLRALNESNPVVGSSQNNKGGSVMICESKYLRVFVKKDAYNEKTSLFMTSAFQIEVSNSDSGIYIYIYIYICYSETVKSVIS